MFAVLQVFVKIVITAIVCFIAVFMAIRVWRYDLDLRRLLSPKRALESTVDEKLSWLPTREKDVLYQNGRIVARVIGATVKESEDQVFFEEIYQSNNLDHSIEFEFQKWKLRFRSANELVNINGTAPQKGRIYKRVVCNIVGVREAI